MSASDTCSGWDAAMSNDDVVSRILAENIKQAKPCSDPSEPHTRRALPRFFFQIANEGLPSDPSCRSDLDPIKFEKF
jgi:hypothetical protein